MVSTGEYMSSEVINNVPMLEHDYFYLRPEDYDRWRAYARQLAVDTPIKREDATRVAQLIDTYPDPELDLIQGRTNLDELKGYIPKIESLTEMAEAHKLDIGGYIRVRALTSAQYNRALFLSGEGDNNNWYIIGIGMVHPPVLEGTDDAAIKDAALKVSTWPLVNVRLIGNKIQRLTLHPGDQRKRNESDAFTDFFGQDG